MMRKSRCRRIRPVIIIASLTAVIIICIWNSRLPSYLTKLHVGGKINEFFHNLISNDDCNNTRPPHYPTGVMIIGGMNFIGARLGRGLLKGGVDVMVTEDIVNIDRDPLKWYRWAELTKLRANCTIYDFNNVQSVLKILKMHSPKVIVYVPTKLFSNYKDPIWKHKHYYDILRNALSLLEAIKIKAIRYLLVVLPAEGKSDGITVSYTRILKSHFSLFSRQTGFNVAMVSANKNLYGPWQDIVSLKQFKKLSSTTAREHHIDHYISSLAFMIKSHANEWIKQDNKLTESTEKWIINYNNNNNRKKDVVSGATLMFKYCYHCFFFTDSLDYIREWFISAVRYNLNILLIHNTFSNELQTRLKSIYPSVETYYAQCVNKKAATDQRFYILYNYLLEHSEINRIMFTDQRDVKFLNDPFKVMTGIGNDYLYVGHDDDRCIRSIDDNFIKKQLHWCYPQYANTKTEKELLYLAGCLSSGVLGGSRYTMLTLLAHMKIIFESANARVCDMISVGLPAHTKLYDIVFTLYPFNSGFDSKTPGPFGLAVKHKISMY